MDHIDFIQQKVAASIALKERVLQNQELMAAVEAASLAVIECFKNDGAVFFCGNGGSAADAQHLAAEFSGRFYHDRDPLFSEALHVNTSYITAVANDYSYEQVYSRLVKAKCRKGNVLIGMSTSGNSGNVVQAFAQAKKQGVITIGMTGAGGGKMAPLSDILIEIPSKDTPRIQECHMLLGHTICEITENALFDVGR